MTQFDVELVGGPYPGKRRLSTPRDRPPHQIPVVLRDQQAAPVLDQVPAARPIVAVYRYSRFDDRDERYVYTFLFERSRPVRP